MTPRSLPCLLLVLLVLAAGGCSSTKVVETWRDPSLTEPLDFGRTLVIALAKDPYTRNVAEDTLVERIGADRAVAGHTVLSDEDLWKRQPVRYLLSKGSYDGVVTIGIVGMQTRETRGAGPAADGAEPFYAYYDRAGAFLMTDGGGGGATGTETVYRVETRVYTVKGERLVWRAISDTVDPKDTHSAVLEIAKAVGAEMRRQKVIR